MNKETTSEIAKEPNKTEIPLECSEEEFQTLCSEVSNLTIDEAKEELLECARYGEIDAVRAILDRFDDIVDTKDPSGSTALHKASANGHVSTVRLLLQRGAKHFPNDAGNTPLHWAAAAGHESIVQCLLQETRLNIDVLQKNEFGRSALTEGFSSKDTAVAKLLLEHDSATEERLIMGAEEVESADNKKSTDVPERKLTDSVVHEFSLADESKSTADGITSTFRIRELPIERADNPFGDDAEQDTTGYGIWCASIVMARWMASSEMTKRFAGKKIVELGAGCGVPGLSAAVYSNASRVYLTDLNPKTIENLEHNAKLNDSCSSQSKGRIVAKRIDWDDESTWPTEKFDYVIGSDLIYQASIVPLLRKVVLGLLKRHDGRFLYCAPDTGRDGLDDFIAAMKCDGCELVNETVAPQEYHSNPLASGDDDECFLHFHELTTSTYILYEFRINRAE